MGINEEERYRITVESDAVPKLDMPLKSLDFDFGMRFGTSERRS